MTTVRRLALVVLLPIVSADLQDVRTEAVKVTSQDLVEEKTCANYDGKGASCSSDGEEQKPVRTNLEECGVWLAPSSIPGAGVGMYAGRDFEKGEPLQPSGEIVVPDIDILQHQYELSQADKYFNLWDSYTWSGFGLLMSNEAHVEAKVQSPGFGSAANSFLDLVNVDERRPDNSIPHGLHRSKDPGVGAFSTYHNRESIATAPIQRGQEFFVDYGPSWFLDRPLMGPIPLKGDLDLATHLFRDHLEIRKKYPNLSSDLFDDMWRTFVMDSEFVDSRVMGAFHKTQEEWQQLFDGKTMKEIRIEEGMRTDEWLREHGTCADNIREGESTIRQAGRGAFATRKLVKDSVVAPMPLIHISDFHILEMLEFQDIRDFKTEGKRIGMQLSLNYCFGHEESTLLLCPYGPLTSLINHNSTQANVRLKWADPKKGNHDPEVLQKPIEHFEKDSTAKLAMEVVAMRDILPDEEIFLDYGPEWEDAWTQYESHWRPVGGSEDYVSAFQLNSSPDRLRTVFEQLDHPYPDNVYVECDQTFFQTIDFDKFQKTGEIESKNYHDVLMKTCEVLRFEEVNGTLLYTAVVRVEEDQNEKLTRAPREAFRFVDRPYTTDMFLPNAFRHPMMIPDDLFPEYWMNL